MSNPEAPRTNRVLVADAVSDLGVDVLRNAPGMDVTVRTGMSPEELAEVIGEYHGLIVRSATKVTADVLSRSGSLRAIGRAGTGVDNIDLAAATRAGVVVMNTPGGNSVAAAELTMSLLLALARNVPQANAELREGRWQRKKYMGTEVAGKTLGVVGLGRIGREVARRAQGFRMDVIGYDPFVPTDVAGDFGVRAMPLEELVGQSDFITLHLPVNDTTRGLFGTELLGRVKKGTRLINCARGGLIDEAALLEALENGSVAGAALDVFESEPPEDLRLVQHPSVVATPHLGASTREAQVRVGVEIAEKLRDYLQCGVILDAVNFPAIGRDEYAGLAPAMDLAERAGSFLGQIAEGGFKRLEVRTFGSLSELSLKPLAMAATKGVLARVVEGSVSYVNALELAKDRGVTVDEGRSTEASPYAGLLRLTLETDRASTSVAATLLAPDRARVVEIDGMSIECDPRGDMLFIRNRDVPGVVGRIGSILGDAGVNIAGIHLGRGAGTDAAVSIVNVDTAVTDDALSRIREIPEIVAASAVTV